ncbi:hypothetical protein V495_04219 [Pseudogymnoascus sp. VKM F-4514 (FW-929)]|nr:hypothetical protein V490_01856 [Pseudogymnoascus sp. VKM F-3557]KFY43018.1 hypothetical protein V495_04219 [Pseudogymnoascus sp. VKM F-4514 (FW-929)]KFY57005.1 hypothetical protein V497_05835 [Pseudogymnoascus sp. VKM F-4516 (FW-969)]
MTSSSSHVAIIGAGLSGLSLGLVLHSQSIPCKIYESRDASYNQGGGIMLSPNALRILDTLGVYSRIVEKGYSFESLAFMNGTGKLEGEYFFGDQQRYGYKALRIYRHIILQEMIALVKERGIPIFFNTKINTVLSETDDEVTFQLEDCSTKSAAILVGADGIHSKIRRYINPAAVPVYSGTLALTSSVSTSTLRFPTPLVNGGPTTYPLPAAISAAPGGFVIAPQDVNGDDSLVGTQRIFPERDRAGWDALRSEPELLLSLLKQDIKDWPDLVQSALEAVEQGKVSAWPFYTLPRLEKWASAGHRVIVVGDAAHAIPPTTGQGVNQAFEDTYTLGLLLAKQSDAEGLTLPSSLNWWQGWRQERIDQILELTRKMNNKRLPEAEQVKLAKGEVWKQREEGARGEMDWLFRVDCKEEVEGWVAGEIRRTDLS